MFDILKKKEFWTGSHFGVIVFTIVLLIILSLNAHFFPNEFEEKGRKKLCELKQYEYCTKKELLKIIK
tara:strand:+ start:3369 stop:3572 length:204 start_codon:yes stop_codon:yes gene_type:complete